VRFYVEMHRTLTLGAALPGLHQKAIRASAKLFFLLLPPYSPDLNPIARFARLKKLLRMATEINVDATWHRIGGLLACFSPQDCAHYFANAGYASA
jgi:transposase